MNSKQHLPRSLALIRVIPVAPVALAAVLFALLSGAVAQPGIAYTTTLK